MKAKIKPYVLAILLTEAVGLAAGLLTRRAAEIYGSTILKPPLSPPAWVFPVAWTILYALMGAAAARIWLKEESPRRTGALRLYAVQLGFNFFWSILFFSFQAFGLAFAWLIVLWALIVRMTLSFGEQDRIAARLLLPYLLWVAFAGYLNCGVWLLNR